MLFQRRCRQRAGWDEAPWEQVAARIAPVHDHLVRLLAPRPGDRWIDVATGTGAVAIRAAALGAHVTAVDIAPRLIERARGKAVENGVDVEFLIGDAEALPFPREAFDVVASAFGVEEPPDHAAVGRELTRVCRPTGTIGLAVWANDPEWEAVRALAHRSGSGAKPEGMRWAEPEYVEGLLGTRFSLRLEEGLIRLSADSGEVAWRTATGTGGMLNSVVARLSRSRREDFHEAYVRYHERYRVGGHVRVPKRYVIMVATSRDGAR